MTAALLPAPFLCRPASLRRRERLSKRVAQPRASADATLAAFALLSTCSAAASQLEQRTWLGKAASAPVLALGVAACARGAGLLAGGGTEAAIGVIWEALLPIAVALSLLTTDVLDLRPYSTALGCFAVATAATVLGTAVAFALVGTALGPDASRLAACLCASYIGGSVNFAAVASAVGFASSGSQALCAAMAVDNLAMAVFLAVLLQLARRAEQPTHGMPVVMAVPESSVTTTSLATALACALCCTAMARAVATRMGAASWQLALIAGIAPATAALLARLPEGQRPSLAGAEQCAGSLLLLLFAGLGAAVDVRAAASLGLPTFAFIAVQLAAHLVVVLTLGRLLQLPRHLLLLASNAAVGGPATAAAMASATSWPGLVRPAILLGCVGYAVGTPIGVLMNHLLQRWPTTV
jgi:uncharacterized membrane protein